MRKIFSYSLIVSTMLIMSGCGKEVTPPIYKWSEYSYTSVAYGMYGDREVIRQKHQDELSKIIEQSKSANKKVAPGIYAEYAQVLYESKNKLEAKKYFILEKETYPESTIFINRVLVKLYGDVK